MGGNSKPGKKPPSKENVVFYGASTPKAKENKKEKRKNNKLFCLFLLMVQVVEVLNLIMSWILQANNISTKQEE